MRSGADEAEEGRGARGRKAAGWQCCEHAAVDERCCEQVNPRLQELEETSAAATTTRPYEVVSLHTDIACFGRRSAASTRIHVHTGLPYCGCGEGLLKTAVREVEKAFLSYHSLSRSSSKYPPLQHISTQSLPKLISEIRNGPPATGPLFANSHTLTLSHSLLTAVPCPHSLSPRRCLSLHCFCLSANAS